MPERQPIPAIEDEFSDASLGDPRRTQRLVTVAAGLAQRPSGSFPEAAESDAALEGTYRLLNNEAVKAEAIFAVHQRRSRQRAQAHEQVLVVHDTTTFTFEGEPRKGLGPILHKHGARGFFAHVALLVSPQRQPLGVIGYEHFCRTQQSKSKRSRKTRMADPENENKRWWNLVHKTQQQLPHGPRALHVMDREADSYALLAQLQEHQYSFVIRLCSDRVLAPVDGDTEEPLRLSQWMASLEHVAERDVQLQKRASKLPKTRKIHPPRKDRKARLLISAASVQIQRPARLHQDAPQTLSLNVVRVYEPDPPANEDPVQWTLLTSEPIETAADVERIVDAYRCRWVIEEYFKALKTGCAFEKRQLESLDALLRALAIFIPIAWRLLLLRSMAHQQPDTPADFALTKGQLAILCTRPKHPLAPNATVAQALLAIAALGGHIKNNGAPGWQTLGRGFEKLLWMELGWAAAQPQTSDQS